MGFLDNSESNQIKKQLTKDDIAEKYSVIISFSHTTQIQINLVSNQKDASRFFIKDDFPFFSKSQKKVLQDVRDSSGWGSEVDILGFFENLKKSGFSIYLKEKKAIQKISFNTDDIKKENKIPMYLFQAKKTDFFPVAENDFVFRVRKEAAFDEIKNRILFNHQHVIYIKDTQIVIRKISQDISEILNRVIGKNYDTVSSFFSDKFETKLDEEQIFRVNDILKEAKDFFDLETNLTPDYVVKKYTNSVEKIMVDFDIDKKILDIKAVVDYGFMQVDVSETVFIKIISGENLFSRRANNFYGYRYIFTIDKKKILYTEVEHQKEVELYKHILSFSGELGFNKKLKLNKKGARQINTFLDLNWKYFKNLPYKISYTNNKIDKQRLDFAADVNVSFSGEREDWLSFDAEFYLGENKVTLSQLKLYATGKQDYIIGTNGEIIEVKNKNELERFIAMISAFHENKETGKFEGKLYSAIDLENVFTSSKHYTTKFNEGFKKFIREAKSNKPIENVKIDPRYKDVLREYQKEGLDWMYFLKKYHFGGVLADDMGLGKTIQTLVMLEINRVKNKPSIVIVPKTLIGNWVEETRKFAKKTSFTVIEGSQYEREELIKNSTSFDVIITSYSFFQRDAAVYKDSKITFNYAVLDEAQYIKNFKTKNAQIVKEIDADFRLALTGTPLENSVSEIWSIFEFLMPGFLGKQSDFSKNFIIPIVKNGQTKKLEDLRKKISIFMLRRTKESVLKELPEKTVQNMIIPLTEDQNILYQEVLANIKSDLIKNMDEKSFGKSYMNILAALTRLRQICNHPNLILKNREYEKYSSAKMELFLNLVSEIHSEGRKVLVFSQFKTMLEILKKELEKKGVKYSYLVGETKNRKEVIDNFNLNEEITVFLISLKAGGVGINLTSADNVILFDPWWNPSVERQAIDRVHRIGQKRKVNVYKLISKGTIEEKILSLQEKKQGLFDSLIDDSGDSFKKLSWDDIRGLFG